MNLEEKLKAKSIPLMQKYMWIDQPTEIQKEQVILLKDALTICQQEIDEAKPKWISIKDRLPEASSELLLHTRSGSRYIGFYKESRKLFICYGVDKKEIDDINVTHWMPLPESPKENT